MVLLFFGAREKISSKFEEETKKLFLYFFSGIAIWVNGLFSISSKDFGEISGSPGNTN